MRRLTVTVFERSIGVHDGTFHADEVTACALLSMCHLIDKEKIIRTRDPLVLERCEFVCDVGGIYDPKRKRFDHHQAEYKGELSSAGMVLLFLFEKKYLTREEFDFFNESLVRGVDGHDNGKVLHEPGVCTFSHIIANFTPISYEVTAEEQMEAFLKAFDFACGHLIRLRERFHYNANCREAVRKAMDRNKTCLFFDHPIPWLDSFFSLGGKQHSALFVMMPSGEHWKLRGIPPDYAHRMNVRVPLPQEWAGLLGEELKKASGIQGAVFCHKGRFTSVWETRQDAEKALKFVLKKNGIKNEDHF